MLARQEVVRKDMGVRLPHLQDINEVIFHMPYIPFVGVLWNFFCHNYLLCGTTFRELRIACIYYSYFFELHDLF